MTTVKTQGLDSLPFSFIRILSQERSEAIKLSFSYDISFKKSSVRNIYLLRIKFNSMKKYKLSYFSCTSLLYNNYIFLKIMFKGMI